MRGALRKRTYITAAVEDDADDLALLDLRQLELRKSFATIDVVLKANLAVVVRWNGRG